LVDGVDPAFIVGCEERPSSAHALDRAAAALEGHVRSGGCTPGVGGDLGLAAPTVPSSSPMIAAPQLITGPGQEPRRGELPPSVPSWIVNEWRCWRAFSRPL